MDFSADSELAQEMFGNSVAIELDNVPQEYAEDAARSIKSMNGQEAVLLQEIPVVSKLI